MISKRESSPRQYIPEDVPYNPARNVSVVIIGAGIAGIATAILLQNKVPNLTYTVIERNAGFGGTWWENRYPGVRCDVPSHSYQLSFEPNPKWTEFYASGPEIQAYYDQTARKHGLQAHTQFRHEATRTAWSPKQAQWHVDVKDLDSGESYVLNADFVVSAAGRLNTAALPDIHGLDQFAGPVVHTADWDASVEWRGKRVAVIGNGASGMQILPSILPDVKHLHHFVRSRTWVSPWFRGGLLSAPADSPGGYQYSQEELEDFETDVEAHLEYRRNLDLKFHSGFEAYKTGSEANAALRKQLTDLMSERINHDQELLSKLVPAYAPGCKRLTPAPGYLEALTSPKVTYVTDGIVRATESGLVTADGQEHKLDVIIAATGFPEFTVPRYPIVGQDGVTLESLWSPQGEIGYPKSYFGVMAPKFPNMFFVLQVQGTSLGGTVPVQCEQTATYIARCIRKIQSQSYSALEPSQDATDDFDAVVGGFFASKVSTDSCSSWWKIGQGNTRITVSWPGSGHHKWDISREPRWEDFVFHRRSGALRNRFEYFGNGYTQKEVDGDQEALVRYLRPRGKVDLRTIHESWTEQT